MTRLNPPYGIWTIWKELFLLPKLSFLSVFVLCVYSLWTAVVAIMQARNFAGASLEVEIAAGRRAMIALGDRCAKLQKLKGALFYIFGFVLFLDLQWAFITIDRSTALVAWLIMDNFQIVFVFGANVFFLFAVIHLALWFTSSRVDAFASKLAVQKL